MATKNIVPNADGEGQLGTSSKSWAQGHIDSITGTIATAAQGSITSLGTLTTLTVDNVIINGATIGHTSDTDLLTLADQSLTVAGALTVSGTGNSAFSGPVFISHSSGDSLTLTKNTTEPSLRIEGDTNKDFTITVSGELLTFTQNDGSTDILTLDHDTKNATFAGGVAIAGASSLPVSNSGLNAGIQIPTSAQLGFGNGGSSRPDFGFAVQGTSGSAKLNIFCGTGDDTVDAFIDTNGFIHAAALFLGGESSPNTLDDYEEGSWTPRITDGTDVAQSNGTYTRGDYTKVGRLVHCSGQIVLTDLTSSGGAEVNGAIRMDGFPFANRNVQGAQSTGMIGSASFLNITAGHTVVLQMLLNVAEAGFRLTDSTGGTTDMQASEFSDDGQITFSISYMTDS